MYGLVIAVAEKLALIFLFLDNVCVCECVCVCILRVPTLFTIKQIVSFIFPEYFFCGFNAL